MITISSAFQSMVRIAKNIQEPEMASFRWLGLASKGMRRSDLDALVVCPVCHGSLLRTADELTCASCGRRYPVVRGVPILVHPDSPFFGAPRTAANPGPPGLRASLLA